MGFRYGSLVEDLYTGYRLHCQGWKSIFCQPQRAAFLGNIPISLLDAVNQVKRWTVGILEFSFSKSSPLTFGIRSMGGPLMSFDYVHYGFLPLWSVAITIYTFLPQLTLLNGIYIFPKVCMTTVQISAFHELLKFLRKLVLLSTLLIFINQFGIKILNQVLNGA